MEDFGIFYGSQALDLDAGLYVVHGENGRGKTTIINAIKWVFFGRFEDRQGRTVDPKGILNRDAKREGSTKFSVGLTLTDDDGVKTIARRTWEASGDGGLYVERDGKPLNQAEAEITLQNYLEKNVARFFLFDGEQLREYEELLFEEDEATQSEAVRRSIEQILGLPVLEQAITDFRAVDKDFEGKITKLARRTGKTEKLSRMVEQLETEVAEARKDLKGLEGLRDAEQEKVDQAATVLQENEAAQELVNQMEALQVQLETLTSQREERVADRKRELADTWEDALAIAVAPRREALEAEVEAHEVAARAAYDAEQIERSLAKIACDLCGQDLGDEVVARLRARLDQIELGEAEDGGHDPRQELAALLRITRSGAISRAIAFDERISEANTKRVGLEQDMEKIRDEIGRAPTDDIRVAGDQHAKSLEQIGAIKKQIEDAEAAINEKERKRRDLVQEISSNSDDDGEMKALKERDKLAADLADLFAEARAGFRDNLRGQVERDASDIFLRLTTDPNHLGLRINTGYGLETIGPNDEVFPTRSAGQEQIVALSLIGALNRNATRQAPVMMDTPFGRLDKRHRAKVLAFLGEMADQVFLLVHSAEVDEADLKAIAPHIKEELSLKRIDSFRTEIRRFEANG